MWFKFCLIKSSNLLGNIISDFEETVGTSTLSVDNSLWDSLSSEMSELVQEGEVLGEDWATWSSSKGVSVVVNWGTRGGGHNFLFHI